MGRARRTDKADYIYHVLNRANARTTLFAKNSDYQLFETILELGKERTDMRILAYCIMPNHWHIVVQPKKDGDLSKFVNWITLTHTQRVHAQQKTIGYGHLYQGRYKSFLCSTDAYFLQLVRYVERNALRANLVKHAQDWRWSSIWRREHGTLSQKRLLNRWPIRYPKEYVRRVHEPQSESELEALRRSVNRGNPFGADRWAERIVRQFGLETTLHPRGRPGKGS